MADTQEERRDLKKKKRKKLRTLPLDTGYGSGGAYGGASGYGQGSKDKGETPIPGKKDEEK